VGLYAEPGSLMGTAAAACVDQARYPAVVPRRGSSRRYPKGRPPRAEDLGGRSKIAYATAMAYVALLFGFGHFYKGPAGVLDSTYSGLVLGSVYLLTGRNLWASILTHGISDTFAVLVVFMGWAT
jgi:Type II CAAX prenyl endopeptidase Rce1-like